MEKLSIVDTDEETSNVVCPNEHEAEADRTNFLLMPSVVREKLFRYFGPKELLTLRRVCTSTHTWISEPSRRGWKGCRIDVNDYAGTLKTFEAAAQSGLKATEIVINNTAADENIFQSSGISNFLLKCGSYIQKVKIYRLATPFGPDVFNFFESLSNLRELKVEYLYYQQQQGHKLLPPNLSNLAALKIGVLMDTEQQGNNYHWDLVNSCTRLQHLRIPPIPRGFDARLVNLLRIQMATGEVSLKILDFKEDATYEGRDPITLPLLLDQVYNKKFPLIQFRNLSFKDLKGILIATPAERRPWFNSTVRSVTDFPPLVSRAEIQNLEKLAMSYSMASYHEQTLDVSGDWPKLNEIAISFDTGALQFSSEVITHFLFVTEKRPLVQKLSITYHYGVQDNPELINLIRIKALSQNFENLMILKIEAWNLKNGQFSKLWEGLTKLEELSVSNCSTFGNAALVGNNRRDPSFLKLRKLRKLTLEQVEEMPLVTDLAFTEVFSRMPLKEFYLGSEDPIAKVTVSGILSLLDGEFGQSIEKFPFQYWSLANVPAEQFKSLGKRFRSIL